MAQTFFAVCLGLALTCSWLPVWAQVSNPTASLPAQTDQRIDSFNEPHMSWVPAKQPRGQLLVFLPGTGGQPKSHFPFASTASDLGYHVISLMYPDSVAAQQDCMNSSDPDAYMKFRLAIISGGDSSSGLHIEQADSIENRLNKLLHYLTRQQPKQGWEQFLDRSGQTAWDKIVISGHSQGGGHAFVLSKIHQVARCIMFGSPKDYSRYFNASAKGFDGDSKTPKDRYFAFNHLEDHKGGCNHDQQMEIFQKIGLTSLGQATADKSAPPYNHAHLIFTDVQLPNMDNPNTAHGAVISGVAPVCLPVWQYLLSEPVR